MSTNDEDEREQPRAQISSAEKQYNRKVSNVELSKLPAVRENSEKTLLKESSQTSAEKRRILRKISIKTVDEEEREFNMNDIL